MDRPDAMFDRDWEWAQLVAFGRDARPGATLGVVSGRRRQGKSFLLHELCRATGGFYFNATEATESDSLRLLGAAIAEHLHLPAPLALLSWEQAVDALLSLATQHPLPIVLDEFPYLCKASPALPSVLQKAFGPRRSERLSSRARMLLCGSALTFMGGLLAGSAPLRGRAGLDLAVHTFDPRVAAAFWQVEDWRLALRLHSVVGGTPAYRREYVRDDAPADLADFDDWVCRTVLSPASPLFREARYLLAEDTDLRGGALYHSVLAAVAAGRTTRAAIASFIGRRDDALSHPLTVLADAGFLAREEDLLRATRPTYRITEPLVAFYHAVMRPDWGRLERPGGAEAVWRDARSRFASQVLGPHFEQLCRWWAATQADPATFGAVPARVGPAVVRDGAGRATHQLDVVVADSAGRILSLGETKAGAVMGVADLERLQRIRALLAGRDDVDASEARLACYAGAGWTAELAERGERGEVTLIDLGRLYAGA